MPGTVVRDANAPNLLTGATLNSAGTTTGTVWDAQWPGEVTFFMDTGTIDSGTGDETMDVLIQGCETSDFTTADVVRLGQFKIEDNDDDKVFGFTTYVDTRYVRTSVTAGGTSPDFSGTTLYPVLPHDRRVRDTAGGGIGFPTSAAIV